MGKYIKWQLIALAVFALSTAMAQTPIPKVKERPSSIADVSGDYLVQNPVETRILIAKQQDLIDQQKTKIRKLHTYRTQHMREKIGWEKREELLEAELLEKNQELTDLYRAYDSATVTIELQEKLISDYRHAKEVADKVIRLQKEKILAMEEELKTIQEELKNKKGKRIYYYPFGRDSKGQKKRVSSAELDDKASHYAKHIDTIHVSFDDLLLDKYDYGADMIEARYIISRASDGKSIHEGTDYIYCNGRWGEASWKIPITPLNKKGELPPDEYIITIRYNEKVVISNHRFKVVRKLNTEN